MTSSVDPAMMTKPHTLEIHEHDTHVYSTTQVAHELPLGVA
jgi:hypothetical protein